MYVYIYICMCVYVCVYIYVCVCVCIYIYIYICMCVYVCVYIYVCVCVCIYIYIYICMCVYVCVYIYVCVCVYIYIYICMCVYVCLCLCMKTICHLHIISLVFPGKSRLASTEIHVKNAVLKTLYNKHTRIFLGPTTLGLELLVKWSEREHSEMGSVPRIVAILESTMLPVSVGQEHVLCLTKFADHCRTFADSFAASDLDTEKPSSSGERPEEKFVLVQHSSCDDLRNGGFQYVVDNG